MKLPMLIAATLFWSATGWSQSADLESLRQIIERQQREIENLHVRLDRLERGLTMDGKASAVIGESPGEKEAPAHLRAPTEQEQPQAAAPRVAGFRLSGDFRFRLDAAVRGSSEQAGGLQNIRGRYRLRLNADRDIADDLDFHMQLSTGAVNNGITMDQDFAGGISKHPFFIAEAFLDYHPAKNFSIQGGKLQEAYADNFRFLWDDDVRFNGFNEKLRAGRLEFRAGQYFFVNPNVFSISNASPLVLAGKQPGAIARASQLFHQGVTIESRITERWRHQLTGDVQIYRNPNLLALTSNSVGVRSTVDPGIGIQVSGSAPGSGNATRLPDSAILFAPHYQIVRLAYRLDSSQLRGNPRLPLTWTLQMSRNVGTSQLRDAIMTSIVLGRSSQRGDLRGQYMFAIKDANSLISQLTDDDLGTGVGVNLATHHFRLDYNLRPNVVLQNLLFLQTERRSSNPEASFFVPLGRGTPRTWRYLGQIAISF